MNCLIRLSLLSFFGVCLSVQAETYKCNQGGKTVFSDTPCMTGAGRVDHQTDQVERSQKRQADLVHQKNRTQLSELEYRAARDRNVPGSYSIIDSMNSGEPRPLRRR